MIYAYDEVYLSLAQRVLGDMLDFAVNTLKVKLAYYQWQSNRTFLEIEHCVPVESMYGMYATLHEADISLYVDIMNEKCQKIVK